jgi:transposase
MFIRECKTKNKKSGKVYVKHKLVESVWVNGQSRQRTVMGLGLLELPRREWKKLAHALECQLSGQTSLLECRDKYIDDLALNLVSNNSLSKRLSDLTASVKDENTDHFLSIDPDSISCEQSRTYGAELVCHQAWELLHFDQILTQSGFSNRERCIAKALILGRLISPGSERHTIEWFHKRSALSEFPGYFQDQFDKDRFYENGDKLYENKENLETFLFRKQQSLFPQNGLSILLYDLTNTYMEGSCLTNQLAKRGKCKSKRSDCPLITLSLIVRSDGMPVASHIYRGNQSEPETFNDVIARTNRLFGFDSPQLTLEKPTFIMDRGIATQDNITLLESQGYPYVVIRREDQSADYMLEFENARDTFTRIDDLSHKRTPYGDENRVYVKKMEEGADTIKVLCISDGKAHKENAISTKKDSYYLADIEKLSQSIQKGNIKNVDKIQARLDKKNKKYKITAEKFDTTLVLDEAGNALRIDIASKHPKPNPLAGCYIIESTHTSLDAVETWKLYMTLTNIENSFRSMKSTLGVRPVYHQNEERSAAHLFIAVLAYHILFTIEHRLSLEGDTRQWKTLRGVLSTHTRNTIVMKDKNGVFYHRRLTGKPEGAHQDIYKKLGVLDPLKTITSRLNNVVNIGS